MNQSLAIVALRNGAIYLDPECKIDDEFDPEKPRILTKSTVYCLQELIRYGYTLDEKALIGLNKISREDKAALLRAFEQLYGKQLNWTPLIKGWDTPTRETYDDKYTAYLYNLMASFTDVDLGPNVELPCGHLIPEGLFDLSRYNGCPLCGRPFEVNKLEYKAQGSKFTTLTAWDEDDAFQYLLKLLRQTIPPSADQIDSLYLLLEVFELPEMEIPMKETAVVCASASLAVGDVETAKKLLETPADLLRMLWMEVTGNLQVIKPKTLVHAAMKWGMQMCPLLDQSIESAYQMQQDIKLHYTRSRCRMIARILNEMDIQPAKACETMHPKRGMWVRFIRALRLAEYARKPGYEQLREILDRFYRGDYEVLQGRIDKAIMSLKGKLVIKLLSERPGLFARELFATMLRYGKDNVLSAFSQVMPQLPFRLIFSLVNNAETYFGNPSETRPIRTITGVQIDVPINNRLLQHSMRQRIEMGLNVRDLAYHALEQRYAAHPDPGKKIYIDPALRKVTLPVGDRVKVSEGVMSVPQGTSFPILGDKIRLFLQWGKDLPAQHLDLDLSVAIVYDDKAEICNYTNLTTQDDGAIHSGDMQYIPDKVGTAEYIELDLKVLKALKARYVVFVANAYSVGKVPPNAMMGWMDSEFPMSVDKETGVAYDPSSVQHLVKINDSMLQKGVVFGVLDMRNNQIVYMETGFDGQTVNSLNINNVIQMLNKLSQKITIGAALEIMAKAKGMTIVHNPKDIDDQTTVYDRKWAYDIASVSALLIPE